MYPTILDLKTGITKKCKEDRWDAAVFWWTESGGSCDCNRAIEMDQDEEMDAIMRKENPELKEHQSVCYGCRRFIIIDVHGDLEGCSKEEIIKDANSEYLSNLYKPASAGHE